MSESLLAGQLSEQAVDEALRRTLSLRFRLGLFDDPDQPYEHFSPEVVRSGSHVAAAIDSTEQGLVLLKNENGTLPLSGRIAVIGPHATTRRELLGNYLGQICPGNQKEESFGCVENIYEALSNLSTDVTTAPGLPGIDADLDPKLLAEAVAAATAAQHVVLALGINAGSIEREGSDRHNITLPEGQLKLLDAIARVGRPVTVVLINGGIVAISPVKAKANAVVEAWYPGFFGARAIARALLGKSNRWGKLPVTIYDETFTDDFDMLSFDMTKAPGRTYRYFTGKPLWPFGFGLSYTTFALSLQGPRSVTILQKGGTSKIQVQVRNTGPMDGDEVVMAYFRPAQGTLPAGSRAAKLRQQLFGFERVAVAHGQDAMLSFEVTAASLQVFTDAGDAVSYAGKYTVLLSTGNVDVAVDVTVVGKGKQPVLLEPWEPHQAIQSLVV